MSLQLDVYSSRLVRSFRADPLAIFIRFAWKEIKSHGRVEVTGQILFSRYSVR